MDTFANSEDPDEMLHEDLRVSVQILNANLIFSFLESVAIRSANLKINEILMRFFLLMVF